MPKALYQPFPLPGAARAHVWHHVPATRRPRHFHSEPELNLIAAGSALFGVGDAEVAVTAGDLLWWSPGQDHVLLDASPDFDLFVIGLTPELSARVLGDDSHRAHGAALRVRVDSATLNRLASFCATPLSSDPSAVERQVGDFWQHAHGARLLASDKHVLTRRALARLLERPALGRDELALVAKGHPTDVSRHFHRDLGLTLTEYRTRLRLLRFIQLADQGEGNLLEAALHAGFGSYSQCHRAFQATLSCSPREFFGTDVRDQMKDTFLPGATALR